MAARSWLAEEAERIGRLPSRPRWEEVRGLQAEGLDRAQIAQAMGIGERTVGYYETDVTLREG